MVRNKGFIIGSIVVMFFMFAFLPVHAEGTSIPTFDKVLDKAEIPNDVFDVDTLYGMLFNPFENWHDLLFYVLPAFLLTFLVVYAILDEIGIFENKNIIMPLSGVIALIALLSGVVGYVTWIVSNFIALGLLILFLGVVYIGASYYYHKKLKQFGYNIHGHNLLYVFITHIPLIFAVTVGASVIWYYLFGNLPWVGSKGILIGAAVGGILLSLKID